MLTPSVFLTKWIGIVAANAIFSYTLFLVNAFWRAQRGSAHLQHLLDTQRVEWTPSQELDAQLQQACTSVAAQLASEGIAWRWDGGGELHDDAVLVLQRQLKLPELIRTHRRMRNEQLYTK